MFVAVHDHKLAVKKREQSDAGRGVETLHSITHVRRRRDTADAKVAKRLIF